MPSSNFSPALPEYFAITQCIIVGITAFDLRTLAILTMVIDHIGLFFFPDHYSFRIIGRLSFPLFAFLIANGARYTRRPRTYFLRLLLLSLISQIPYSLANLQRDPDFFHINIFFTLTLGLLAIFLTQKLKPVWQRVLVTVALATTNSIIRADYGAFGIISIVAFYYAFPRPFIRTAASQVFLTLVFYFNNPLQLYSVLALPLIRSYNRKAGPKTGFALYFFYPVHLLAIYLVMRWLAFCCS